MAKQRTFRSITAGTIGVLLLAATGAWAQDNTDAVKALDEIIITAQKQEQSLQEVPISVRALSNEMLERIAADSLDEIVRQVPSLSMTDLSRGGNNVQIRGLGSNVANVGTVAIYNDGVISAGRIQSSGTFSEQDSALYDVERVEVLRGPQGTLYGEGSFGGTINIISKAPAADQFDASFSATWFDTDRSSDESFDFAGMLNIPIVKDIFAARIVGFSYDHSGYIDTVNVLPLFFGAPPEFVGADLNTEEVTGGRLSLGWTPNDNFDATLIYKTQDTELGISNYDSPGLVALANELGGTSFEPMYTQAAFSSDFGANNTTDEAILTLNAETGIGSLTSVTGWGDIDLDNAAGLIAANSAFSQEVRLASNDNDGPLNWIVGGFYRSVERDMDLNLGGGTILPFSTNEVDQWSVFGQVYWQLSPSVTATFGLRYGEQDTKLADLLNGLPVVSEDFNDVSPKVAIDWLVDDDTLLYVSAAKGFRAGGTNPDESLGTDPAFVLGFDPDEIWSYEVGLKTGLFNNTVTLNAAVFHIDWKDIQIDAAIASQVSPPFQFIVVNGQDAHSTGVEADIFINPTENWEIVLGGSLVDAEFDNGTIDSATAGLGIPLDGQKLASSPEYLFNASVQRSFSFNNGVGAYVRADHAVRGNSFGDVPNEPPPGGNFRSGRFSNTNLRAGVEFGNWEIQAFATNLSDEYVGTFRFFDGGFGDLNVVTRPRTYGLTVRFNAN